MPLPFLCVHLSLCLLASSSSVPSCPYPSLCASISAPGLWGNAPQPLVCSACSRALSPSLRVCLSLPPSLRLLNRFLLLLGAPILPLLGSAFPTPSAPWPLLLLLRPPCPGSLGFRLYLPPRRPGPLFLSPCPPCGLRVTPRPLPCWLPGRVPPASLSRAGWGIPPGSWKKQLGPRERPSVSPGARPPPSGLGVSPGVGRPEAGSPVVSGFSQAASGSGPRPPANSPNIIPQEESVAAGGGPG